MKICIVTQPLHNNYGGILQNYALQKVLRDMGHEPVTIDYEGRKPSFCRVVLSSCKTLCLRIIGRYRPFHGWRLRKRKIGRFVKDNMSLTERVKKYDERIVKDMGAGAVIVGSDQVWREKYNKGVLEDMYLGFLEQNSQVRRIAYAASFGIDDVEEYTPEQIRRCGTLLKRFALVTVRENTGVDICARYFGVEAVQVLDPTMLLRKEEYERLCVEVPVVRTRFLAAYVLDASPEKKNIVREIAEQNNLEVRDFTADAGSSLSIEEWLAMFRDAEYIVTDSFHGTVFSIIFNKPFSVLANNVRGNARLDSLLSLTGLDSRRIKNMTDLKVTEVTWDSVNVVWAKLLSFSKKTLTEALS